MGDVTVDEVRLRAAAARLILREDRLETVRMLLDDALAPLRRLDPHSVQTLEPAVTFDAAPEAPWRLRGADDAKR
jgi:hypothetical protein